MTTTRADPAAVRSWMQERADEMAALLIDLAGQESPTNDPTSHYGVRDLLETQLQEAGMRPEIVSGQDSGDHLMARPEHTRADSPTQLLLGHLDTVWPLGTLQTMPVERTDDVLAGPGTFDMKSGLVQMLFSLRCLRDLGIAVPAEPVVLINSDEEIGSPESGQLIAELASVAVRAFVLEGSLGPGGDLKTARKGVGRFRLRVKGVAAHAGLDPDSGVSAVLEISQQIQRLFELNDPERGVTVNVGTVDGGLRPNVVAPEASAEIDCRVPTHGDAHRIEEALGALEPIQEGIEIEVEGGFGRPPMEPTRRNRHLWHTAEKAAKELGLDLGEAFVGGASDGNLTSQHTATLDGLGGVGDGAHAPHEHIRLSKMPERASLLTLLLASPVPDGAGRQESNGQDEEDRQ